MTCVYLELQSGKSLFRCPSAVSIHQMILPFLLSVSVVTPSSHLHLFLSFIPSNQFFKIVFTFIFLPLVLFAVLGIWNSIFWYIHQSISSWFSLVSSCSTKNSIRYSPIIFYLHFSYLTMYCFGRLSWYELRIWVSSTDSKDGFTALGSGWSPEWRFVVYTGTATPQTQENGQASPGQAQRNSTSGCWSRCADSDSVTQASICLSLLRDDWNLRCLPLETFHPE